jgi:hypothetical protein
MEPASMELAEARAPFGLGSDPGPLRQTPNLTPFLRVCDAQTTSDVANARCSLAFCAEQKNVLNQ